MKLGRRAVLAASAAASGGIVFSKGLSAMLAEEAAHEDHTLMVQRDAYINQPVDAFPPSKRELVSAMAETIIPRTDTPGAVDAQVPKFIELLYDQWMAGKERSLFDKGLENTERLASQKHGLKFARCSAEQQQAILEQIEEAESDHPWFNLGGPSVGEDRSDFPFMALFKEITVTGFFMSEVGAKQVLRYNMPSSFDPDIHLSSDDSSWAATPFM